MEMGSIFEPPGWISHKQVKFICIYLPQSERQWDRPLQIGLDKKLCFGYRRVDESLWGPAGAQKAA